MSETALHRLAARTETLFSALGALYAFNKNGVRLESPLYHHIYNTSLRLREIADKLQDIASDMHFESVKQDSAEWFTNAHNAILQFAEFAGGTPSPTPSMPVSPPPPAPPISLDGESHGRS